MSRGTVTFGWDKLDKQSLLRSACVAFGIREGCFDHLERQIKKKRLKSWVAMVGGLGSVCSA